MDTGRFQNAISRSVPRSLFLRSALPTMTWPKRAGVGVSSGEDTFSRQLDYGCLCQYIRISEIRPSAVSQKIAPLASTHSPVRRLRNTALNSVANQGPAA